jgi:pimeloyl-ACP methyl ester carboxylesterase
VTATLGRLARPGATIAYRREGAGPPLLLLHATLSSAVQLAPLASRLAAHTDVISVDRRGGGASPFDPGRADVPIDVAAHVDDLSALIAAEHLDACFLVGHSYGGCVALELAARRPELVRGVFAWEPPYAPLASSGEQARLTRLAQETLAAGRDGDPAAAAERFLAGVSGPGAAAVLSDLSLRQRRALGSAAIAEAPLLGLDPHGLSTITCPVTIATGARSGPFYADIALALVERITDARHLEVTGVGHLAPIEAPDIIADAVEGLLDR